MRIWAGVFRHLALRIPPCLPQGQCSTAGKVTVGLASHWPPTTDFVVYPSAGSLVNTPVRNMALLIYIRLHHMHSIDAPLLQTSRIPWSMCVSHRQSLQKWLNPSFCRLIDELAWAQRIMTLDEGAHWHYLANTTERSATMRAYVKSL